MDGHMTLKCPSCGSLNIDTMTKCGNCGTPLAQAEHVKIDVKKTESEYDSDVSSLRCPYCGRPMEEGTFEIASQLPHRPLWVSASGEEPIEEFFAFNGHRCRSCSCMVITY